MCFCSSLLAEGENKDPSVYKKPNLDLPVFDVKEIKLEDARKDEIVNALTCVAVSEDSSMEVKAKALAIALRMDPLNKRAFMANEMLSQKKRPLPFPGSWGDITAMADRLWNLAEELKEADQADKNNFIAATCLMSIYMAMKPDDLDRKYELAVYSKKKEVTMDWQAIVEGIENPIAETKEDEEKETKMKREGSALELARLQSKVKGLLVQQLESNTFAGLASQMNATAEKTSSTHEMNITFDQSVGDDMSTALKKVGKYMRLQHKTLPAGYNVEISFEEQYISKDGPSAAVACALLINSLILGDDIDPYLAVTGDMNADGTVQPVGGITGKLRGAARRDCKVIGIPSSNHRVISDLLIMEGPQAMTRIQIFSLKTFDDAWKLAAVHDKRESSLKQSIDTFTEVQSLLNRPGGLKYLKNAHLRARLNKCLELSPNHLSAKFLLNASMGRVPKKLSLVGSVENIDRTAEPLLRALRQKKYVISDPLAGDEYADTVSALRRLRPKLESRTLKCVDSMINYSTLMRRYATDRPKSINELNKLIAKINSAGSTISQEYDTLFSRVDVKEEMMR